jgi:hypothetical protein
VLSFLLVVVSIVLVLATRSFLTARSSLSRFNPFNFSIFSALLLFASRKVSSANLLMALFVVVVVVASSSSSATRAKEEDFFEGEARRGALLLFFFGVPLDDGVLLFRRTFIFVVRRRESRRVKARAKRFWSKSEKLLFPICSLEKRRSVSSLSQTGMRMQYLPRK